MAYPGFEQGDVDAAEIRPHTHAQLANGSCRGIQLSKVFNAKARTDKDIKISVESYCRLNDIRHRCT